MKYNPSRTPGAGGMVGKLVAATMGLGVGGLGMELQGAAGVLSGSDNPGAKVWQNT